MKKCLNCESLIPTHYSECPKCHQSKFGVHKRAEENKTPKVLVGKDATFGTSVMACHSHVKMS